MDAQADHDVDLEVLERRIQDLLDDRRQPVNLVDEEHVVAIEVGQDRGQVARPLENRSRGLAQVHAHLGGDDVRQRGLAEPRGAEQQQVVECLAAAARRGNEDLELLADLRLPDVVGEPARAQRALDRLLGGRGRGGGDQAVVLDHDLASSFSACLMPSDTAVPGGSWRIVADASRSE